MTDIANVDVVLHNANGDELKRDESTDREPIIIYTPSETDTYAAVYAAQLAEGKSRVWCCHGCDLSVNAEHQPVWLPKPFKRNAVDDFIALVLYIADISDLDQGSQARLAEGLNLFGGLDLDEANSRIRTYLKADTSQLLSETDRTAFARRFAIPDEHGVDVSARLTWLTDQAEQSVVRMLEQTEPPIAPQTADSILSVPRYTLDEVLVSFISEQGVERASAPQYRT